MTKQEILEKAISKAIDGGWKTRSQFLDANSFDYQNDTLYGKGGKLWYFHVNEVIFNHDFAKALWGEKKRPGIIGMPWKVAKKHLKGEQVGDFQATVRQEYVPEWMYHLQQMVVADDPIKYLGDHLDD